MAEASAVEMDPTTVARFWVPYPTTTTSLMLRASSSRMMSMEVLLPTVISWGI
ncbi:MAG: hypothetical protein ACLVK4_16095 [Alistipes shahii]|uniref:hypothetical protein n=1 Tax=Alistipes shahii TaxID=328814 RepID=UPI00399C88A9